MSPKKDSRNYTPPSVTTVPADLIDPARREKLPDYVALALETIGKVPGLNPLFHSSYQGDGTLATFSLRPSLKGREAVKRLARLTGGRAVEHEIKIVVNPGEILHELSPWSTRHLEQSVEKVRTNAEKICALMNENGVDTSAFQGFGKAGAERGK